MDGYKVVKNDLKNGPVVGKLLGSMIKTMVRTYDKCVLFLFVTDR